MATREISRSDGTDLKLIDKDMKNRFKWSWLEEEDCNKMYLSDWTRKVNIESKVMCKLCNDLVNYGSRWQERFKKTCT